MSEATSQAVSNGAEQIQDNVQNLASNVNSKFEDIKSVASEKFETAKTAISDGFGSSKSAIADKLHSAADTIHQKVGHETDNGTVAKYGHKAAHILDRSGDYVGDFDPNQLKSDIQNHVKENPGRTLLIAAAVGLLLGALLQRSRR